MPRALKIVLWIAGILVALLVLLLVVAPLLLPRDQLRSRLMATVEEQLGRPARIEDFSIRLIPSARLRLSGLELGSPPEGPRQEISLESCDLHVALLPLLQRQIKVRRVEIHSPRVVMELPAADSGASGDAAAAGQAGGATEGGRDGTEAAGDQAAGEAGEAGASGAGAQGAADGRGQPNAGGGASPGAGAPPMEIRVEELIIRDGEVTVFAQGGAEPNQPPLLAIGGLSEDLSAAALPDGDWQLEGLTRIESIRAHLPAGTFGEGLRVSFRKKLQYVASGDRLVVEEATLSLGDLPVGTTGVITGLLGGDMRADLELRGGPADVGSLLAYLPAGALPEAKGLQSSGMLELTASIRGPLGAPQPPDFDVRLTVAQGRIEHPQLAEPVTDLTIDLHVTPQLLELRQMSAATGAGRLRARATLREPLLPPAEQHLEAGLEADFDLAQIGPWLPPESGVALEGRLSADLEVSGSPAEPGTLHPSGTVSWSEVGARGEALPAPVSKAHGTVILRGQTVELDSIAANIGQSDLALVGTLRNWAALMDTTGGAGVLMADLSLESRRLDLDELAPPSDASPGNSGAKNNVPGESTGSAGSSGSTGSASKTGAPGPANESPTSRLESLAPLGRVSGQVTVAVDQLTFNQTQARNLHGRVLLDRGRITIEEADLQAFGGQIQVVGDLDGRALGKQLGGASGEQPGGTPDEQLSGGQRAGLRLPFDLRVDVTGAQARELYRYASGLNRYARLGEFLSGTISTQASLSGNLLEDFSLDLGNLSSDGKLETHGARIADHPLQNSLASYLDAPQIKQLAISDWMQRFEIRDGKLHFEDLDFEAEDVGLTGSGWQALDGSVGMALNLTLPKTMSGQALKELPSELRPVLLDASGKQLELPILVSGQFNSPKVALDTQALSARAEGLLRQRLAEERDRITDRLGDEAGSLIEGLLNDEKTGADSSKTGQKKDLEEGVKGLLENLLKKK